MKTPKPSALPWLLASVLVIALDQWSKAWVLASLPEHTAVPVIDGFWNWYRTYNTGAAFSFLADAGGWQQWFFIVLAFAISAVLAWMLARTPRGDWKQALPLALVIGGAIGNVIDRFLHGHVIDFIQLHAGGGYFPSFNLADSAITLGAICLIVDELLRMRQARRPARQRRRDRPRATVGDQGREQRWRQVQGKHRHPQQRHARQSQHHGGQAHPLRLIAHMANLTCSVVPRPAVLCTVSSAPTNSACSRMPSMP